MLEFYARGGKLDVYELRRYNVLSQRRDTPGFARFEKMGRRLRQQHVRDLERIGVELLPYQVSPRQAEAATVSIDGVGEFHVTGDGEFGDRIDPGERAARAAGWTDEQIEQARQAGCLYPDAVLAKITAPVDSDLTISSVSVSVGGEP
jgi:hypothetical protein